ncbi:diguanylate cyclase [Clostridium sp. C2-6-12]|uniref:diguanylate cyclase n=1 Tax=Clostridium sp. C2-6-12 TaxID=2698832 RepID=UPI001370B32D|nr:diguanylate cyclase [Clostridium sp. C2-6-12]
MCDNNFKVEEPIRIILNKNNRIENSSIDEKIAYGYLKNLSIFKQSFDDKSIKYILKNYFVTIDKIALNNEDYSVITINSLCDCKKCHLALIDKATGLYNRNYLEQVIQESKDNDKLRVMSILMIDIDNLKSINDKNGHLEGDRAIKLVSQAITRSIRKHDIAIRYGGDEFVIILFDEDIVGVNRIEDRIRKEMKNNSPSVSVSIGIADTKNFIDVKELIKMADEKLYQEKDKKKLLKQIETPKLNYIKQEIEKLREELNSNIIENLHDINNKETLELSQKLDDLISSYLNNISYI